MLIGIVFFCSLVISAYGMRACEEEQELAFHECDHDIDFVLDRLGFQKDKKVYRDIKMPGVNGHTPLQQAIMWGDVNATKEISRHPNLGLNCRHRCECVHRAMLRAAMFAGDMTLVQKLSKSPVLCLSESEREVIFMRAHLFLMLFDLGFSPKSRVFVDINASDYETGDCALVRAVLRNDFEIFRALLTFEDLNLNRSDSYGTTALIQAIISKYDDFLKVLFQDDRPRIFNGYYLDINCADCVGLSPLMWAIKVNNELAIHWLCADHRLDPTRTDEKNRSALDWAYLMGNELAIEKLKLLMPKVTPRSSRSSVNQKFPDSSPRTPRYETPQSPRSLEQIVPHSPRLSVLMPSLSAPQL